MKKIVKKYGNSLIVLLDSEDIKIYNLKENDIIDVEISKVRKVKK